MFHTWRAGRSRAGAARDELEEELPRREPSGARRARLSQERRKAGKRHPSVSAACPTYIKGQRAHGRGAEGRGRRAAGIAGAATSGTATAPLPLVATSPALSRHIKASEQIKLNKTKQNTHTPHTPDTHTPHTHTPVVGILSKLFCCCKFASSCCNSGAS